MHRNKLNIRYTNIPYSRMRTSNMVKMHTASRLICEFNAISIKIPIRYVRVYVWNLTIDGKIHVGEQKPRITKKC